MGALTAREFFSETCAIGADAVSMASLMKSAGWGFVLDSDNNITTQPSLDSFNGITASVVPTADLYVGHDQYVRDATAVGPPRMYKGCLASAGLPYDLQKHTRGVVDPDSIYFYSPSGAQDLQITFQGA